MKAAELLAKLLKQHGVSVVFGYPGAAICPFFDALSKTDIRLVTVRQEQMAGHAASGYARISGAPGVCAVTSGPGALNLLPAIAAAYMDSIPLIVITGQVSSELIGRDVFQEVDITGAAEPFIKHSYLVKDASALSKIAAEAFYIASTGRKGPVLLDIPEDVLRTELSENEDTKKLLFCTQKAGYLAAPAVDINYIDKAAELIKFAKRPLVCIGGGVFGGNAQEEAETFIKSTGFPFVTTMMGLSALSPLLSQSVGRIGMYGDKAANRALKDCDLLLLCGARVGDRAIMSPLGVSRATSIIHIDIDPAELNKNMKTDIPIAGDIKTVLPLLLERIVGEGFTDWIKVCAPTKRLRCRKDSVSPEYIMESLCKMVNNDAVFAVDVGQHLIWAANGYRIEKGRFLASGGMGTMGYSLPAGIGAAIADPKRQVIVLCGDGGFQMNFCELATVMQEKLPLKLLVFQNHGLGLVRELQNHEYGGNTVSVNLKGDPDFALLASAYGIKAFRASSDSELSGVMSQWIKAEAAALLICEIAPNETAGSPLRAKHNN